MNLQAVIATNLLGFAMLVVLLITSRSARLRGQNSDKIFTSVIIVTAFACIIEMISFMVDGHNSIFSRAANMMTNSLLYMANIIDSYLWCVYVDQRLNGSERTSPKLYLILAIPALGGMIELLLNFRFGFLFSFDKGNFYHREPLGYSHLVITVIYLGLSLLIKFQHYRKNGKLRFFPIWMFLLPVTIGAVTQIFMYGVSIVWCCVALGLIGIHMCLQNELAYMDPLTKLYNRTYMNFIIANMESKYREVGGIMLDMDYFKAINDTYGHEAGDNALSDISSIIRKCIPDNTIPIRFAGDEFIIFCPEYNEDKMDTIIGDLRYAADQFNKKGEREYKLSFSAGISILDESKNIDVFLKELDDRMYDEKKTKHRK